MRQAGIDLAFLEKRVMDFLDMSPGDLYLPGSRRNWSRPGAFSASGQFGSSGYP
jgi:hypothetical protein